MKHRKRIYVAGAYSADNVIAVLANMKRGIDVSVAVLKAGYAPFSPWLDFQFGLNADIPLQDYYEYSIAWLPVSDAVLVVEGWENSKGTIAEIAEAERLGVPVYYDLKTMMMYEPAER